MKLFEIVEKKMYWLPEARDAVGQMEPWGDTIPFNELPQGSKRLYQVYSDPRGSAASDGYYNKPELTIYESPDGAIWFFDHYRWNEKDPNRDITKFKISKEQFEQGLIPFTGPFKEFLRSWSEDHQHKRKH